MQTPHILIVEDELVTRNTLKSIFEAEGYIVLEANTGCPLYKSDAAEETPRVDIGERNRRKKA